MRIAFVTNFCPHYRVKTYEELSRRQNVDYYFFSVGKEWYWQQQNGIGGGDFKFQYLRGLTVGHTRITLDLPWKLSTKGYDLYLKCINGKWALPMTYLAARLRRKPFVLWTGLWSRVDTPFHRFVFPITRYIYRHADALVAYGEHVKRYLVDEGVRSDRIFVAPHAVDNATCGRPVTEAERQYVRRDLHVEPGAKILLYVGRLEMAKGVTYLLEAFEALDRSDAALVFVGDGSLSPSLQATAADSRLAQRVRFAGHVPSQLTAAYYAAAFVTVVPSISTPEFREPWGLVVNESFNQGTPVVATEAVGAVAGGLVRHGLNGLVAPEKDVNGLARCLDLMLTYPALRERFGAAALVSIAGWSVSTMVEGFLRAFEYAARARS